MTTYGLIEFGSDSDRSPRVIVGPSRAAVDRMALGIVRDHFENLVPQGWLAEFLVDLTYPDQDDAAAVTAWFDELWEVTTSPCYSRLETDDVTFVTEDTCDVCGLSTAPDTPDRERCAMAL